MTFQRKILSKIICAKISLFQLEHKTAVTKQRCIHLLLKNFYAQSIINPHLSPLCSFSFIWPGNAKNVFWSDQMESPLSWKKLLEDVVTGPKFFQNFCINYYSCCFVSIIILVTPLMSQLSITDLVHNFDKRYMRTK